MLLFKKTAFDVAVSLVVYQKEIKTLKHSKSVYLSRKLLLPAVMSPPIPEPDVTPLLFDSFSSTPSVPELPSQEASLEDSTVEQDLPSEQPIETTYHLVLRGTIRGNTKLVTNTGVKHPHLPCTWRRTGLPAQCGLNPVALSSCCRSAPTTT